MAKKVTDRISKSNRETTPRAAEVFGKNSMKEMIQH